MITVQQTYFMSLELLIQACCTVVVSLLPQNWRLYQQAIASQGDCIDMCTELWLSLRL